MLYHNFNLFKYEFLSFTFLRVGGVGYLSLKALKGALKGQAL